MKRPKIGIIGGVGPLATVDFMDKIIRSTPAKKDQDHLKMVVEHNPQIPDRTAHLLEGGEDPFILLLTCAKNLEAYGADFIVIPCNTAHAYVDRMQEHLQIPIVGMIDAVVQQIDKCHPGIRTLGLMATSGTISTGIYHRAFENTDIDLICPDEPHQQLLMDTIYGEEGIKAGFTRGKPEEYVLEAAASLVRRGAQALILGCTELPLVLAENEALLIEGREVAILDPTSILARKCVSLVLGDFKHTGQRAFNSTHPDR